MEFQSSPNAAHKVSPRFMALVTITIWKEKILLRSKCVRYCNTDCSESTFLWLYTLCRCDLSHYIAIVVGHWQENEIAYVISPWELKATDTFYQQHWFLRVQKEAQHKLKLAAWREIILAIFHRQKNAKEPYVYLAHKESAAVCSYALCHPRVQPESSIVWAAGQSQAQSWCADRQTSSFCTEPSGNTERNTFTPRIINGRCPLNRN